MPKLLMVIKMTKTRAGRLLTVFTLIGFMVLSAQCLFAAQISAINDTKPPNVILWSWDATQRNHCLELLKKGELPNLKALINEGVFLNLTIIDHRTDTKAGHTQMLTGYRWHHTGVFSNGMFFQPIPNGYTLLERVEGYFGKGNVATCMITGKKGHMEVDPVVTGGKYCQKGIFSNVPEDIDVTSVTTDGSAKVGPRMIDFLNRYGSGHFVAFFHFKEPDDVGHRYGENSLQYEAGVKDDDFWLGQVVQKLKDMNIYSKTLIYVTADHGFDEDSTRHSNAPFVWLATNDRRLKVNENESWCDQVDIVPTIYYALGIDTSKFVPPLDGYPLQRLLPAGVAETRKHAFNDKTLPTVSVTFPANGTVITKGQTVSINFTAADDNLIAVLLLINDTLTQLYERQVKGYWIQNEMIEVSGSYRWDTTSFREGSYIITVIVFDEGPNSLPPEIQNTKEVSQSQIKVSVKKEMWSLGSLSLIMAIGLSVFAIIAVAVFIVTKRR